jgi:hypothetical protein
MWRLIIVALLLVACIGGVAVACNRAPDEPARKGASAALSGPGGSAAPSPSAARGDFAATVRGTVPKGSRRSTYPVREADDLSRVCEGWFYPKAPKYTGLAPHSLVTTARNAKLSDAWFEKPIYDLPYDTPAPIKDAWDPKDPAKVQLVACAEQVSIGAKIKDCHVDKPKPKNVPMKVSNFKVTLYEVATRRKLAQLRMTGEDEECGPFAIFVGADGATYSELENRQLIEAFRRYVEE